MVLDSLLSVGFLEISVRCIWLDAELQVSRCQRSFASENIVSAQINVPDHNMSYLLGPSIDR